MNEKNEMLIRIAHYLMLHGSSVSNLGLLNGKMSIVLFFYELGRYTGKKIYDKFAGELLDEIYHEIKLPVIVTKTSGLDEIIEDRISGLKIPVRTRKDVRRVDVKIFTEKINYLLNNLETAKTIGENARKRFLEKYELSLFKRKMLNLYTTI